MPSLGVWVGLGAFALLALFISATFFPAFALALLFIILIIGIIVVAPQFAATPYGIGLIVFILVLAAIFGFVQAGQTISASLVHPL